MGAPQVAPPLPYFTGEEKGRGKREGRGPNPLFFFSQSASYHRGPHHPLWAGVLPTHGPYIPPGVPITLWHSDNYPVPLGTHPVSE